MATTMKLIAKQTLGSDTATVTFSSIPGTYTDLLIYVSGRHSENVSPYVSGSGFVRVNGSTTSYSWRYVRGNGSSVDSGNATNDGLCIGEVPSTFSTANTFGSITAYIPNYAGSTNKSLSAEFASENNGTTAWVGATAALWSNTAAITELTFTIGGGFNWKSGSSFFLYGITKS